MKKCPICNWEGDKFLPCNPNFNHDPSRQLGENCKCPICSSHHRHRGAWLVLETFGLPAKLSRILHVAPEPFLVEKFKQDSIEYTSIDKYIDRFPTGSVIEMDLTDLKFEDNSFDFIYCAHVLEHIFDDGKAITEMFRVLKPGGIAVLSVPVYPIKYTVDLYEHARDTMEHVHQPGPDYYRRYMKAGFSTRVIIPETLFDKDQYGLRPGWDPVVICCKHRNPLVRMLRRISARIW